jgi:ATP-dependent helicase/nuclease subunit B
VQTRFILGPAGSGKTFRCLAEIRAALTAAPDGPPLLLIAPNQTTYQFERELLADGSLPGYTRLNILSFERLAAFIFDQTGQPAPKLLDEEGRLMVLRSLLARKRDQLKLFRASARLTGFAQHLSLALRELQRHQLTPEALIKQAETLNEFPGLSFKLHDLATLLRDYLDWLKNHELQDADYLLDFATKTLRENTHPFSLDEIWLDGFMELSPQELDLLAELLPHAPRANLNFCLDRAPTEKISWLSHWSVVRKAYQRCHHRLAKLPNCELITEVLPRRTEPSRFTQSPALRHLESNWAEPKPFTESKSHAADLVKSLRVITCANPEAEATLAAREILSFVRNGGRYRDISVLTRDLRHYHDPLTNIFRRYNIPCFIDRRESISHHPLAELSRNALRTVALKWVRDDWFAALKTGLVPATETEIDRLENEALARGWKGDTWQKPIHITDQPQLSAELETIRARIIKPFHNLATNLGKSPSGTELARALREFWKLLDVPETLQKWSEADDRPQPIHITVWERMNAWLENIELAFPTESLPLREWLPILEAGLASLTAGVIPPALDQVLIGAIDRSRNPDIRLELVLGMNETVFPAPPQSSVLLTDSDRMQLERHGLELMTARQQLSHERYYGYIACTRARERLVLTSSSTDATGKSLNPSPFLTHIKKIFPSLNFEIADQNPDWRAGEHPSELIAPILRNQAAEPQNQNAELTRLNLLPAFAPWRERLKHLAPPAEKDSLSPPLATRLYGPILRTSVSRMEQFAACPFKFFVHSGLRAEERKLFELDIRDQGNFQHEVLANFHDQLRADQQRWRDITPEEARDRIEKIAIGKLISFREGLLQSSDEGKFTAKVLIESLQDFVETLIGWMRKQYAFDPMQVEVPFDDSAANFPPWKLDLGDGHQLWLTGRIDRIDIFPDATGETALCAVVDYKSTQKQLDSLLMRHGLQLQLPAYLNVLRHWKNPLPMFGVVKLIPAGVFYVNLRGKYERGPNRDTALDEADAARKLAYRHSGRFNAETLDKLDQRLDAVKGDQFNYQRNKDGRISANSREAMKPRAFLQLLDDTESALVKMGEAVYAGETKVDPYRKGTLIACEQCDYRSICRIDPWTHHYRVLRKPDEEEGSE